MTDERDKQQQTTQGIPLPGEPDVKPRKPDFLQGDEWFETQVDDDFLDFDEPYRPPRYTMERDGVPFADVGELHIISGKPGNGKTGLMSQLEAATLGAKFGNTVSREVGHIVRDADGNIVVGHVLQEDGQVAFFYEEDTYEAVSGGGYTMVYKSLPIDKITEGKYSLIH